MTLIPPTRTDSIESDTTTSTTTTTKKSSSDTIKKSNNNSDLPSHTIRTSSRDQKLDKHRYHNTSITNIKKSNLSSTSTTVSPLSTINFPRKIKLTSIELLRQSIDENLDKDLLNIIRNFVYVGTIDSESSLIQHDTQLYLVHTRHLSQELFYQLCIYHFGNMGTISLQPKPPSIQVNFFFF